MGHSVARHAVAGSCQASASCRTFQTKTLSGWTTATVGEQWLSVAGILPCGWATGIMHSLTRAFTCATAVPTVMLRVSWLHWKVQAWRRTSVCDVRAMHVQPNHCMPVARALGICPHSGPCASSFLCYMCLCFHVVSEDVCCYFPPPSSSLPSFVYPFCPYIVTILCNRYHEDCKLINIENKSVCRYK
jgi:hypothetical protein